MRKKKHPEHVNHERWLVSYADFITLLFAFFVVMFATSQVDTQKVGRFTESFQKAVGIDVFPENGKTMLGGNAAVAATTVNGKGQEMLPLELEDLRTTLEKNAQSGEITGVEVIVRRNELVLRLADNVVFDSGNDEIRGTARVVLGRMAADLKPRHVAVRVEGHTDDRPIKNARFHSNWDLSTARATAVVADFIGAGIEPERLSAAGYAEFHPLASNATAEGRAQNRRVDIIVSVEPAEPTSLTDAEDAGVDLGSASSADASTELAQEGEKKL